MVCAAQRGLWVGAVLRCPEYMETSKASLTSNQPHPAGRPSQVWVSDDQAQQPPWRHWRLKAVCDAHQPSQAHRRPLHRPVSRGARDCACPQPRPRGCSSPGRPMTPSRAHSPSTEVLGVPALHLGTPQMEFRSQERGEVGIAAKHQTREVVPSTHPGFQGPKGKASRNRCSRAR